MERGEPLIRLRDVVKIYRTKNVRFKALDSVSLDICPGEFVAVVGTSGCGKSTLLNLTAGLEKPTSGKIFVRRRPIHRMSEEELVDFRLEHVGFIFQNFNLISSLTAVENAAFPLMLRGVPERERNRRAGKLLERMGLSGHLRHYPGELSGGQQQRVAIARALITNPSILFADEPTGNLDSHTANQIIELLRSIVQKNHTTLLLVTHDMEKTRYAHRVIHLADGRITGTGTGGEYP
jgi:putative ABC transport system ATP-binding protein